MRLLGNVIVAYHIFLLTIFAVGSRGVVVEKHKALRALNYIHEVYFLSVGFRLALFQRFVLAVFYGCTDVGARYHKLAFGDIQQIGFSEPFESCIPLSLVLVILRIELLQVYRGIRHGVESVFPFSLCHPCSGFLLRHLL